MLDVPAARFEDSADERGRQAILRSVDAFVTTHGVDGDVRDQIAAALTVSLETASTHAVVRAGAWLGVTADVMSGDVQLVLRLCDGRSPTGDDDDPVGGFELWMSFPRVDRRGE